MSHLVSGTLLVELAHDEASRAVLRELPFILPDVPVSGVGVMIKRIRHCLCSQLSRLAILITGGGPLGVCLYGTPLSRDE